MSLVPPVRVHRDPGWFLTEKNVTRVHTGYRPLCPLYLNTTMVHERLPEKRLGVHRGPSRAGTGREAREEVSLDQESCVVGRSTPVDVLYVLSYSLEESSRNLSGLLRVSTTTTLTPPTRKGVLGGDNLMDLPHFGVVAPTLPRHQ